MHLASMTNFTLACLQTGPWILPKFDPTHPVWPSILGHDRALKDLFQKVSDKMYKSYCNTFKKSAATLNSTMYKIEN